MGASWGRGALIFRMNLYEIIVHAMETDDAAPERIAAKLKGTYATASSDARALMDDIFISLTGWSFATLLDKEREAQDEDAEV
jgi:hypothetical protein